MGRATPKRRIRSRRACRRLRNRRVRLRVSVSPPGGRYDLAVRGRGRFRRVATDWATTTFVYRASPGRRLRRLRFRARVRAASGSPGAFRASRVVRLRGVRCA